MRASIEGGGCLPSLLADQTLYTLTDSADGQVRTARADKVRQHNKQVPSSAAHFLII
jgi:hypothetical protein